EYVRAWGIQLAAEDGSLTPGLRDRFLELARRDPSPVVRLYLASAAQRVPDDTAWPIVEALALHGEDAQDRNIPLLLWQTIAQRMPADVDRALALAESTLLPQIREWTYWFAATLEGDPIERVVATLENAEPRLLHRRLASLWLAMEPRANIPMPDAWSRLAPGLLAHDDLKIRRLAERLAAAFGDTSMLPALRRTLADRDADREARRHAFDVLNRAQDPESLPLLLGLLDDPDFRSPALNLLARF